LASDLPGFDPETLRRVPKGDEGGDWKKPEMGEQTQESFEGQGDSELFSAWMNATAANQVKGWKTPIWPELP
jgi:hypothetical protein